MTLINLRKMLRKTSGRGVMIYGQADWTQEFGMETKTWKILLYFMAEKEKDAEGDFGDDMFFDDLLL